MGLKVRRSLDFSLNTELNYAERVSEFSVVGCVRQSQPNPVQSMCSPSSWRGNRSKVARFVKLSFIFSLSVLPCPDFYEPSLPFCGVFRNSFRPGGSFDV